MSLLKGKQLIAIVVALVSTILSPIIGAALYPMADEFADQLMAAMNLSGAARAFAWWGAVFLALVAEIVLVVLLAVVLAKLVLWFCSLFNIKVQN